MKLFVETDANIFCILYHFTGNPCKIEVTDHYEQTVLVLDIDISGSTPDLVNLLDHDSKSVISIEMTEMEYQEFHRQMVVCFEMNLHAHIIPKGYGKLWRKLIKRAIIDTESDKL